MKKQTSKSAFSKKWITLATQKGCFCVWFGSMLSSRAEKHTQGQVTTFNAGILKMLNKYVYFNFRQRQHSYRRLHCTLDDFPSHKRDSPFPFLSTTMTLGLLFGILLLCLYLGSVLGLSLRLYKISISYSFIIQPLGW